MRDKVKAEQIFKEYAIEDNVDFQLTFIALLNWCELLLYELNGVVNGRAGSQNVQYQLIFTSWKGLPFAPIHEIGFGYGRECVEVEEQSAFVDAALNEVVRGAVSERNRSQQAVFGRERIQIGVEGEIIILIVSRPDHAIFRFPRNDRARESLHSN